MGRPSIPIHDLYALRTAIHLSAAEVAQQCEVSRSTYYGWETGRYNPGRQHRRRLARVLRVSEQRLLHGEPA